ncbi:hypothetical protein GQ607_012901 [Colletotrichum asianum]|uniref:Uncharacterized protein n=1 Tax=Colletotrichum asianum TaxID=702518 RepID=A0A8H3W4D0_9PEZI|nr:hypothetical protein GQ607_012901 [Colletotrichum asianum]
MQQMRQLCVFIRVVGLELLYTRRSCTWGEVVEQGARKMPAARKKRKEREHLGREMRGESQAGEKKNDEKARTRSCC